MWQCRLQILDHVWWPAVDNYFCEKRESVEFIAETSPLNFGETSKTTKFGCYDVICVADGFLDRHAALCQTKSSRETFGDTHTADIVPSESL